MSVDEMQFGFMPESGTVDVVFILRWMQEEYHAKGKRLYMCFVDLEKAFDTDQGIKESVGMGNETERNTKDLIRSVLILYEGAKTRICVDYELSEEI